MPRVKASEEELRGGYFRYCQWCEHDGNCILRHCEFMGAPCSDRVDPNGYPGHEDLRWHFSWAQAGTSRSTCNGRIKPTNAFFIPLACECGTAISGVCRKMKPNEKHARSMVIAEKIAKEKGIELSEVDPTEFPYPEFDPSYKYICGQY